MKRKLWLLMITTLLLFIEMGCKKSSIEDADYPHNSAYCIDCGTDLIVDSLINAIAIVIEKDGRYILSTNKNAIDRYEKNKKESYINNPDEVYFPCEKSLLEKYKKDGLKVLISGNVFDCLISDPWSLYARIGYQLELSYIKKL